MPHSEDKRQEDDPPGILVAALAQMSYLLSQTFLPIVGLLPLLVLVRRPNLPSLARCHLNQALKASLIILAIQIFFALAFFMMSGLSTLYGWIIVELYFLLISPFAILGMIGLGKALAGKNYVFPLIGRQCRDENL